MKLESITLQGQTKPVVRPNALDELKQVWKLLGLRERPTIVLVGGAGGMDEEGITRVQTFFEKYLIPFVNQKKATVIDGGTDSGVMAAIGRMRDKTKSNFPLVGVVARDVEDIKTMLEPSHSHFIFAPGSNWGDESEWIAASASALSGDMPSIAILINGGQITWIDARLNVEYGRPVMIAEGSGRTADVIATTSTGVGFEPKAIALLRTGKVHVANFFKEPEKFMAKMDSLMR